MISKKNPENTSDNIDQAMYELVKERRNEPANIPLTEVVEDGDFDLVELLTGFDPDEE